MKSSLEIAQEAELVPVEMIAESCGLQPDLLGHLLDRLEDSVLCDLEAALHVHSMVG